MSTANNIPNNVLIQQDTPNQVIVNQDSQNMVTVQTGTVTTGLSRRHIHTQASPADTWTISHSLGGYPSVTVVDSASTAVIGEVSYISTSQVVVEFTAPFSGQAYLT